MIKKELKRNMFFIDLLQEIWIMNKKQKILIIISTIIFLFVTLNPSVFRISPLDIWGYDGTGKYPSRSPYFTIRPMYQNWAVIAVPSVAFFYYFKDKNKTS